MRRSSGWRGLPIGNLTSQFFSNVYLNELDQFVKHRLKVRHYLRYSDDFVFVHEDPAQLLAWREAIQAFLAERLRLSLTDPLAKPQPIRNGVDFLGYIVQLDEGFGPAVACREMLTFRFLAGLGVRCQ